MRITITAIFLVLLVSGCKDTSVENEKIIRPIDWVEVKSSSFDQIRRLSGTIQSLESTNLSFQVGGKIKHIAGKLGDRVNKGAVLATLDKRLFKMSQQSSQANLNKAKSALAEAHNEYLRYSELSDQGLISKSGYDSAQMAYESANSSVNLAKSQLDISNKNLQDTVIYAPYDAKITKRLVEPSMQVGAGQTIFEVAGINGLEVNVLVPESLIRDLSKGMAISINFPVFPDKKGHGIITEIGSRAQTANAFPVTILIESELNNLRAGMTAEIDFTFQGVGISGHHGDIYRLPIGAIGAGANQSAYVFVYDTSDQSVYKRTVKVENILNNQVLISSGIKNGDIIAIAGVPFLRDGQHVNLLDKHVKRFN